MIERILFGVSFIAFLFLKYKIKKLEIEILDHIKISHHKDYTDLSVPLMGRADFGFVLGKRIISKHKRLPQDVLLKEKYVQFISLYRIFIGVSVFVAITLIFIIFASL